jgi:signal transduction histidine kinase
VAPVSLSSRERHLLVVVSDDGRGFDPRAAVDPGIGLAGMYERAELLGGILSIQSAIGHGTRVTLNLPLRAAS